VRRNKGSCFPFISPLSVQLDRDEKTMVQPDVLVICRKDAEDLFRENNIIFGAPDFVLEVISPSSVRKDAVIKMRKYKEAGVREFWLIDPKEKVLFVYDLENEQGNVVYLYSFNEKVPVRIWNGALEIDLADMYQSIEWLYERRM
jgi:Uma2 family endonuclease